MPLHYIVIRYPQQMVQMAFCDLWHTIHKQVTNVSQHVFVILLWGILTSPLSCFPPTALVSHSPPFPHCDVYPAHLAASLIGHSVRSKAHVTPLMGRSTFCVYEDLNYCVCCLSLVGRFLPDKLQRHKALPHVAMTWAVFLRF